MANSRRSAGWAAVVVGLGLFAGIGSAPAASDETPSTRPTAATSPVEDGFRLLFDGTTKGWRQLGGKSLPAGWDIDDGALHHKPGAGGGDITIDETFDNFELRFEFKIAKDGNSGVKYRVVERPNQSSALGLEYQVVDAHSTKADNKGKHSIASIYELVASHVAAPKPAGEWQHGAIIVRRDHIEHWLNGAKTAEIDYGSPEWKAAFAASKWAKSNPEFAGEAKGHIVLQDHGDEVWFRDLWIKVLDAN